MHIARIDCLNLFRPLFSLGSRTSYSQPPRMLQVLKMLGHRESSLSSLITEHTINGPTIRLNRQPHLPSRLRGLTSNKNLKLITYAPTIATISMGLGQDYVLSLPLESDYAAQCSTFQAGFLSFNPSNTLFAYTLSADLKTITFSSPATTFSNV
jgi:hypothetical protein